MTANLERLLWALLLVLPLMLAFLLWLGALVLLELRDLNRKMRLDP